MVEAGAKEVSEEEIVQALEHAHAAIKEIVAGIDALAKEAGKAKMRGQAEGDRRRRSTREVEGKAYGPLADAMRIKDKLENYGKVDAVLAELRPAIPKTETGEARRRQGGLQGAQGEGHARRSARARQAARRPRVRRDPSDHDRGRRAAAHPRLRACSPAARPRRS